MFQYVDMSKFRGRKQLSLVPDQGNSAFVEPKYLEGLAGLCSLNLPPTHRHISRITTANHCLKMFSSTVWVLLLYPQNGCFIFSYMLSIYLFMLLVQLHVSWSMSVRCPLLSLVSPLLSKYWPIIDGDFCCFGPPLLSWNPHRYPPKTLAFPCGSH